MIKNIIFDFGNVLLEWNPRRVFQKIIPPGDLDRFMDEVWSPEWNDNLDRGVTFADNERAMSEKYPQHARYIGYFHENWRDSLGAVNEESVALLADLKRAGLRTFGLSNWSAETFHDYRAGNPFFDMLDDILISGDVGICKPDPAIYNILLRRHSLEPSESLFIDDRRDNIDAALNLGLDAIHFQSASQVREELKERGIPLLAE